MKRSDDSAKNVDRGELDLPDWSGMDDSSARISPDTAFRLSEQYHAWLPDPAAKWQLRNVEKCVVEFVL